MECIKTMTSGEQKYLGDIQARLDQLKGYLNSHSIDAATATATDWYNHLSAIKQIEGNTGLWLSFLASMMARDYLVKTLDVVPYDVSETTQGAPGLDVEAQVRKHFERHLQEALRSAPRLAPSFDVEARTRSGERVIGEIKITMPCGANGLGVNQKIAIERDLEQLGREEAKHKFLFFTDARTHLQVTKDYGLLHPDVNIVLL